MRERMNFAGDSEACWLRKSKNVMPIIMGLSMFVDGSIKQTWQRNNCDSESPNLGIFFLKRFHGDSLVTDSASQINIRATPIMISKSQKDQFVLYGGYFWL